MILNHARDPQAVFLCITYIQSAEKVI